VADQGEFPALDLAVAAQLYEHYITSAL